MCPLPGQILRLENGLEEWLDNCVDWPPMCSTEAFAAILNLMDEQAAGALKFFEDKQLIYFNGELKNGNQK